MGGLLSRAAGERQQQQQHPPPLPLTHAEEQEQEEQEQQQQQQQQHPPPLPLTHAEQQEQQKQEQEQPGTLLADLEGSFIEYTYLGAPFPAYVKKVYPDDAADAEGSLKGFAALTFPLSDDADAVLDVHLTSDPSVSTVQPSLDHIYYNHAYRCSMADEAEKIKENCCMITDEDTLEYFLLIDTCALLTTDDIDYLKSVDERLCRHLKVASLKPEVKLSPTIADWTEREKRDFNEMILDTAELCATAVSATPTRTGKLRKAFRETDVGGSRLRDELCRCSRPSRCSAAAWPAVA